MEADGEFVVAGGEAAVVFELVDAAFDGVPVLVDGRVERWRSATGAAPSLAVVRLTPDPGQVVVWSGGLWGRLGGPGGHALFVL